MPTTLFSRVFGTGTPFARWTGALARWYLGRTSLVTAVNIARFLVQLTVWFALLAGTAFVVTGVSIAMLGFPFLIAGVREAIQPYLQTVGGRAAFWAVLLVLGYVLSKMRVRSRLVYEIAEWLTGAAACWVGVQRGRRDSCRRTSARGVGARRRCLPDGSPVGQCHRRA